MLHHRKLSVSSMIDPKKNLVKLETFCKFGLPLRQLLLWLAVATLFIYQELSKDMQGKKFVISSNLWLGPDFKFFTCSLSKKNLQDSYAILN